MLLTIDFVVSLLRTVSDTDSGDAWELAFHAAQAPSAH
jgi:hypothetical protein